MEDLFDDEMMFENLDLDEEEYVEDEKFKSALFGFNKRTVMNHINSLEQTIDQMQKNLEGQIKELINEKEGLSQEKNYLEQEYTMAKQEKETIESELVSLNQEYKKVLSILDQKAEFEQISKTLNLDNNTLQEQNTKLVSKLEELKEVFDLAKKQENQYKEEIEHLKESLISKERIIEEIQNKNALMNSEIDGYEKEISKLNDKYNDALLAKEHLQEDLKNKLVEIENMTAILEHQKEEITKLNEEKSEYFNSQEVQVKTVFERPQENIVQEQVNTSNNFEDFLDDLKLEIKQIQDQLQTIHFQTLETQRINQENFDQALLPLIQKFEYLESAIRKNRREDYSNPGLNQSITQRQSPIPESVRVSDYEKKMNALEQQKSIYANELEQKIIEMYQKIAKSS